ncbi:hypothetical protein LINPERHAP1_LOCUS23849 [Linum perenne]
MPEPPIHHSQHTLHSVIQPIHCNHYIGKKHRTSYKNLQFMLQTSLKEEQPHTKTIYTDLEKGPSGHQSPLKACIASVECKLNIALMHGHLQNSVSHSIESISSNNNILSKAGKFNQPLQKLPTITMHYKTHNYIRCQHMDPNYLKINNYFAKYLPLIPKQFDFLPPIPTSHWPRAIVRA